MSSPTIDTTETGLTVGEVAEESGVAVSAVRFYEKHGLVEATRTSGNQRRFSEDASCRIKVARVAQRVGLTVREIVEILADLPPDAQPRDWSRVQTALINEAEERIAHLRRQLDDLGSGAKLCEIDAVPIHTDEPRQN